MSNIFVCTAKKACELMSHMNENDTVVLLVFDKKNLIHDEPEKIRKKKGEELIKQADDILYQDNDFFGTLSLYGVRKENRSIIHNILFPQLE